MVRTAIFSSLYMLTRYMPRSTDELFKSAAYLTDCYLPDAEAPEADTAPSSDGTKQPEVSLKRQCKESGRLPGLGKLPAKLSTMGHAGLADLALGRTSALSQLGDMASSRHVGLASRQEDSGLVVPPQKVMFGKHLMHAPFNLAFRTDAPYFQWLETHENQARFKRFGKAMTGTSAWEVPGAVVSGGLSVEYGCPFGR